jgi:hypothetical protein
MADDDTFNQIRLIRSRLESIEHSQEVLVRVEAPMIWASIEEAFGQDPALADVFLLVDGIRTQSQIVAALRAAGAAVVSDATVSRKVTRLREELHIIEVVVSPGQGIVHAKSRLDRILGLTARTQAWKRRQGQGDGS